MDTEPHIETETNEKQHIPYKYENAKDSDYHPQQYNNSIEVSESSGDIMKKINEEANKLNGKSIVCRTGASYTRCEINKQNIPFAPA